MARYVPVTADRYATKSWRRTTSFGFAANDKIVPIVAPEIGQAALSFPLAFIQQDDRYHLVGVLSLGGPNLFVASDGHWGVGYLPAAYRAYPFRFLRAVDLDEQVLCIDEESGLVVEGGEGEAFFDAGGNPAQATRAVVEFVRGLEAGRRMADACAAMLAEAELLAPWEITASLPGGKRQRIQGLYRVDEEAMNRLPDEKYLALRRSAALPLAYAHLLSMAQVTTLEYLAKLRQPSPTTPMTSIDSIDELFGEGDDVARFNFEDLPDKP